jgi:hypothetical protein
MSGVNLRSVYRQHSFHTMNRRHFIRSAAALPFISAIAAEKPNA